MNSNEIFEFYNNGAEINRLESGLGIIEFYRTKEIINSYWPSKNLVVYDIGGGIGKYSQWLSEMNNDVTLIELAPNAVEYAKQNQNIEYSYKAEVGNALNINKPDSSADVVLLMGPLYHLQNRKDRLKALSEAYRVLKKGGLIFIAGISKFSSTTWSLSVYGNANNFIDDNIYFDMLKDELYSGNHNRPREYPFIIADAYFHTIDGLRNEVADSNFEIINSHAIEGCIWFTPELNEKWNDIGSRKRLLDIIHITEHEETLMGMSPHFMVVAKK